MQVSSTTPAAIPPLFAAVDGRVADLGGEEAVFFETATGRSHVMTRDVAQAFALCQGFLPMEQHVARIVQALPALKGQEAAVQKVLDMFVARDLMRSDAQFIAGFSADAAAAQTQKQVPVAGLFLCAPSASGVLRNALDALAAHVQRFGFQWPVHIVDLSTDEALAREHADAVADFARNSGLSVRHVDATQVEAIRKRLAQAFPQQAETLRWLLTPAGSGTGAARNLVTLLAAGSRALVLDADTALPLLDHPERASGLFADARAFALRSFDSPQAAQTAGAAPDADPLAAHLAVCGLSLAEAMSLQSDAALQPEGLFGVVASRAPALHPERRVAWTTVGRAGRFALNDPTLPFRLDPAERAGLVASRDSYLAGYREPSLWVGTRHYQVGQGDRLAPLALDAGQLLPCTLPGAASHGELFAALLRLAHPQATDLGFPQALARIAPGNAADDALGRPDAAQCLAGLAAYVAQDLYSAEPAQRLAVMAARLADMAGGSDETLDRYLSEYLAYHRSTVIGRMQQMLASEKSPPVYWLADLRAAVEAQGKALAGGEVPRLAGWPAGLDRAACAAAFRAELQGLADGLAVWPAVFEHARAHAAEWRDAIGA
ncbi:MAG: hypothetical protein WDA70_02075 [Lysobacteraceae bacterium]